MSQDLWTAVDQYIGATIAREDRVLAGVLEASASAGLPPIAVAPNQGKLLGLLAKMQDAHKVLEIGTLAGYSAIWLARALGPRGRLITLELDPNHAAVARANVERAGLSRVVEVRVGAALETLPELERAGEGPFDMIFIDADKPNIPAYFEWAIKLSRRRGLIVVDNVVRDGALADAASEDDAVRGVRRLHDMIANDRRVTATTIQTVGVKGYDGFTVALVNEA